MTLPLANTADGGTSGSVVTIADTASGDAWEDVTRGTGGGGDVTWDSTTSAHGGMSIKLAQGGTATGQWVSWTTSLGTITEVFGRMAFNVGAAYPTGGQRVVRFLNGATKAAGVAITNLGKWQLIATSTGDASIGATSTTTVPLNTWVRVEFHILFSATVATLELRYFADPNTTTIAESLSFTNQNTGGFASATVVQFCQVGSQAINNSNWIDDLALVAGDWIGPVRGATPPRRMPLGV